MPDPLEQGQAQNTHRRGGRTTIELRHVLISTPVIVAIVAAISAGVVKTMDWYSSRVLQRLTFEHGIIEKALAESDRARAASLLLFMTKAGFLKEINQSYIEEVSSNNGAGLPVFHGAAFRDNWIKPVEAAAMLTCLKKYDGPIEDEFTLRLYVGVMKFQEDSHIKIDGLLGPETLLALWKDTSSCTDLLRSKERRPIT